MEEKEDLEERVKVRRGWTRGSWSEEEEGGKEASTLDRSAGATFPGN